jgi:hypothetical protein
MINEEVFHFLSVVFGMNHPWYNDVYNFCIKNLPRVKWDMNDFS